MDEEVDKMTFEESLKGLEEMVRKLESGELDLDSSLQVYERAIALRDHCRRILDESERRVQKIMETSEGTERKDLPVSK
ncbi:MAG: exodeoxyribonuclease VII small subunit [Candidatus Methanomethylophilaceae archaeon]|jgi:exodeoxyribonuclease VII small subunit|nr:exodeoxyribonuclease VII small subunit [Candidatus Methanomethylophilaceae archaeon]NLF33871.1 exodeoxyribonuclease VII small subunit [Thermoplasmatales archaeon]